MLMRDSHVSPKKRSSIDASDYRTITHPVLTWPHNRCGFSNMRRLASAVVDSRNDQSCFWSRLACGARTSQRRRRRRGGIRQRWSPLCLTRAAVYRRLPAPRWSPTRASRSGFISCRISSARQFRLGTPWLRPLGCPREPDIPAPIIVAAPTPCSRARDLRRFVPAS
jgi:hypothetical protein